MTRKHAIRDARDVTRKSKESQDVYRCRYCHFWHVGHAATKTLLERKRLRSLKWGRQNMRVDDGED